MIHLFLIGIGTGNPDHVTAQAVKAINAADLILLPLKGADKADLAGLRREICSNLLTNSRTRIVEFDLPRRDAEAPDYLAGVGDWHDAIAAVWEDHIRRHLDADGGRVALLVWGDPSLYDSTLRIAERVGRRLPTTRHVIPGITAIQALCAAHGIPLNELGAPVHITTGRRLRAEGWPPGADTVIVMLDAGGAFQAIPSEEVTIWWGAYVGMAGEMLISGPLAEVSVRIAEARAAARAARGWIMDIYLMRRRASPESGPAPAGSIRNRTA